MLKKFSIPVMLLLVLLLGACSTLQLPWSNSSAGQASRTVEDKLAVGILKLNGTDLSVTQAQAQDLLSLWKGVKSLGASSTASTEEMSALYGQIEGVLTANQVQAIQQMSLSTADLDALMQKYNSTQTVQNASTTSTTSQSAQAGSAQSGAPGGGGGMPAGDPGTGDPNMAAGAAAMTGQTGTQANSVVVQVGSAPQTSTNVLLANSVITMLEQLLKA